MRRIALHTARAHKTNTSGERGRNKALTGEKVASRKYNCCRHVDGKEQRHTRGACQKFAGIVSYLERGVVGGRRAGQRMELAAADRLALRPASVSDAARGLLGVPFL